jgi:threonine dehydratase
MIELVVTGDTYDAAAAASLAEAAATGAVVVPAFDHPDTIAGQGTVAKEIVEQFGHAPDVLIVPVGGGGMLSGCLTWLAERHPETKVVGAEPAEAASMAAALAAGHPVDLVDLDTFVDGAAVRRVGELTHAVVAAHSPELYAVPTGRICSEMLALYQTEGIVSEPAGALAVAALGQFRPEPASTVVVIVSGGNNDISRYSEIIERSLVFEGRKHYFLVNFPQEPGALRRFLDEVLGPDDDITHFEYVKRSNRETGPALVGIELGDPATLGDFITRLDASPITFEVVSSDSPFYRFLV